MKNNILKNTLLIYLATVTAFLFVPMFMIGNDPIEYKFIDKTVFFSTSVLYILIVGTILSVVSMILEYFKLSKTNTFIIHFALSWIVISGFIMSVAASTVMVLTHLNPTNWINLIIVLILSLLFASLSLKSFKKYIHIFLFVVVITSIISPIIYMYNVKSEILTNSYPSHKLSNKKNILVIGFDGLPGKDVNSIIKNNKKYSQEFKDFTIFENAVSQSPATTLSLMGDIYGIQDYKSKGETLFIVNERLKKEGLFSKTISNHIEDSFQFKYDGLGIKEIQLDYSINQIRKRNASFYFFGYPIVRMFGSIGARILNKTNGMLHLNKYVQKLTISYELKTQLQKHHKSGKNNTHIGDVSGSIFDSFTTNLSVSDKELSLRYLHISFTHFPVNIDAECNFRANDIVWFNANQNEQGIRNSDICAVKKFINFLDKLKELNIYDKSLIIFKSDHSKPTPYYSSYPENLRINKNLLMGYNRFKPTLMIKDFDTNRSEAMYKSELVLLNDIAKTLCEKANVHNECEAFNGINLLGDSLETNEPYYLYVLKDAESSHYSDYVSVKIPSRKISLLQAMKDSELINLDVSPNNPIDDLKKYGIIK